MDTIAEHVTRLRRQAEAERAAGLTNTASATDDLADAYEIAHTKGHTTMYTCDYEIVTLTTDKVESLAIVQDRDEATRIATEHAEKHDIHVVVIARPNYGMHRVVLSVDR